MITFAQTHYKSSNNFERYKNMHIEHYLTSKRTNWVTYHSDDGSVTVIFKCSENVDDYNIPTYTTIEDFLDINDFDKNLKNNIQFVFGSDED